MRVSDLWLKYQALLEQASPSPQADFRWLVEEALNSQVATLGVRDESELTQIQQTKIESLLKRRIAGEPVGYILGYWEFWGRKFTVGPGVLIPRPETECLVDQALKSFVRSQRLYYADFGSGTGCLALTLALEFPQAKGVAVESSRQATFYFKKNFQQFNLDERVTLIESTVESLDARFQSNFDLVVMNPPYIAEDDERVDRSVRQFEPAQALFAEDQGLQSIREWVKKAEFVLRSGGLMYCEFGQGQAQEVLEIVTSAGNFSNVEIKTDLSNVDRFVVAKKI